MRQVALKSNPWDTKYNFGPLLGYMVSHYLMWVIQGVFPSTSLDISTNIAIYSAEFLHTTSYTQFGMSYLTIPNCVGFPVSQIFSWCLGTDIILFLLAVSGIVFHVACTRSKRSVIIWSSNRVHFPRATGFQARFLNRAEILRATVRANSYPWLSIAKGWSIFLSWFPRSVKLDLCDTNMSEDYSSVDLIEGEWQVMKTTQVVFILNCIGSCHRIASNYLDSSAFKRRIIVVHIFFMQIVHRSKSLVWDADEWFSH